MTGLYICIRWRTWMFRNGRVYHYRKVRFGARGQYSRWDWSKVSPEFLGP